MLSAWNQAVGWMAKSNLVNDSISVHYLVVRRLQWDTIFVVTGALRTSNTARAAPWHLDVTFNEDGSGVRSDHAPRNLTTIRKLALGLIRRDPAKMSLKRKRKKAARDDTYLMMLLSQLNV